MRITFWGTRGSVAVPGPSTVRYGGNTSCVEVRSASGSILVLDCGTGGRLLGRRLAAKRAAGESPDGERAILIGHTHWDHIQGLPFFAPLFTPGERWTVYGPRGIGSSLAETLAGQMQYTYFPIALDHLAADVSYRDLVEGTFSVGDFNVTTHYLNHPALTLGYRIEADGWSIAYCCDHEPFDPALAHGGAPGESTGDAAHAAFLADADVVIHDCQYRASEYGAKQGWGHSTLEYAVDLALGARVGRLLLTHHDPDRDDTQVDALVDEARSRAGATGAALQVEAAAEGMIVDLPPRSLPTGGSGPDRDSATVAPAEAGLARVAELIIDEPTAVALVKAAAEAEEMEVAHAAPVDETESSLADTVIVAQLDGMGAEPIGTKVDPGRARTAAAVVGLTTKFPHPAGGLDVTDWIVLPATISHVRTKLRAARLRSSCRWLAAPRPADETERLSALRALGVLDTPAEDRFDRITEEARRLLDAPIALVTLVDEDRQWFKSRVGMSTPESPRDESLCAYAILSDEVFEVPDLAADDRFADNPAVHGDDHIRYYAGAPLVLPGGQRVGTLCVADHRPRLLDASQTADLRRLAAEVVAELLA